MSTILSAIYFHYKQEKADISAGDISRTEQLYLSHIYVIPPGFFQDPLTSSGALESSRGQFRLHRDHFCMRQWPYTTSAIETNVCYWNCIPNSETLLRCDNTFRDKILPGMQPLCEARSPGMLFYSSFPLSSLCTLLSG